MLKQTKQLNAELSVGPAAFRRLCVETLKTGIIAVGAVASRLQAAVC